MCKPRIRKMAKMKQECVPHSANMRTYRCIQNSNSNLYASDFVSANGIQCLHYTQLPLPPPPPRNAIHFVYLSVCMNSNLARDAYELVFIFEFSVSQQVQCSPGRSSRQRRGAHMHSMAAR